MKVQNFTIQLYMERSYWQLLYPNISYKCLHLRRTNYAQGLRNHVCVYVTYRRYNFLNVIFFFFFFCNCYLAAPRPTSGHYRGDSLTHPMLITAFLHIRPEGHREPRSEVGSLSPAERLVGFEPGTFRF